MGLKPVPSLIERLASKHNIPVITHGALRLIHRQDSAKIVQACRSDNVLILGIEAFTLSEGKVRPETELIADFSELTSIPWDVACLEAARFADAFFAEVKGRLDLWFDFVLKAPRSMTNY